MLRLEPDACFKNEIRISGAQQVLGLKSREFSSDVAAAKAPPGPSEKVPKGTNDFKNGGQESRAVCCGGKPVPKRNSGVFGGTADESSAA